MNYIDPLTTSVAITDFSQWGMVGMAHFRRGKLAHLFSMNKHFQESIRYFIAFPDYISHILSPKQKGIPGHIF